VSLARAGCRGVELVVAFVMEKNVLHLLAWRITITFGTASAMYRQSFDLLSHDEVSLK
jgi:hypothetical protein